MRKDMIKKVVAGSAVLSIFACYTVPSFAYVNEETIYSNIKSNGEIYKTISSTINENEEGTKTKKSEIQKDLPIECNVVYKLNGIEMPVSEIIGKKGKVTIQLKYTNKDEKQVWVNGQSEKMYTPFLVVSGMVLDNDNNKNVEINHGKIINNGEKTIVAGFAIPGLVESLKLKNSKIDVCDSIEITLETECFELSNIMTFASPKVFDSLDISMDDFKELFNKVNELQSASNQIEQGATDLNNGIILLNDGVTVLKDGSNTLNTGVNALKKGASDLNSGAVTLKDGINEYTIQSNKFNKGVAEVSAGASELNRNYGALDSGINDLSNGSDVLSGGANQVSEGATKLADGAQKISSNVDNIAQNVTKLNNGAESLSSGISEITTKVKEQYNILSSEEVPQELIDNMTLIEELQRTNSALEAQLEGSSDEVKEIINNQIDLNNKSINQLKASSTYIQNMGNNSKAEMENLYNGLSDAEKGAAQISGGLKELDDGMKLLSQGTSSLANNSTSIAKGAKDVSDGASNLSIGAAGLVEGSKQVSGGLSVLSNGASSLSKAGEQLNSATKQISSGATELQEGTDSLLNGTNELAKGTGTLVDGINSLSDGSQKLVDGSGTLLDGIKRFNKEGIDNICNLINNNGKNLIRRIEKLEELSNEYTTFASEEKRDNIQFISIMDSMSKADVNRDKKD